MLEGESMQEVLYTSRCLQGSGCRAEEPIKVGHQNFNVETSFSSILSLFHPPTIFSPDKLVLPSHPNLTRSHFNFTCKDATVDVYLVNHVRCERMVCLCRHTQT